MLPKSNETPPNKLIKITPVIIDQKVHTKALDEFGLSRLAPGGISLLQKFLTREIVTRGTSRAGVSGTGRMFPFIGGIICGTYDSYSIGKVAQNSREIFKHTD